MGLDVVSPHRVNNDYHGQFGGGALRHSESQPRLFCRQLYHPVPHSPIPRPATCSPTFNTRCTAQLSNIAKGTLGIKVQESAFAKDVRTDIKILEGIKTSIIDSLNTLGAEKYAKEIKNIKSINLTALLQGSTISAATGDLCFKIAECCGLDRIQPWITNISGLSDKEKEMICNKNIFIALITFDPEFMCIAPNNLLKDKKFILEAVSRNGMLLMRLPDWQDDRDVVRAAVMQNGLAIAYASDRLKKDKFLGVAAVIQCNDAIDCLPETLQKDTDILLMANCKAGLLRNKPPKWSPFIKA